MKAHRIVLPLAILIVAVLGAAFLIRTQPEVEVRKPEVIPPLVRVVEIERRDVPLDVQAQGTVLPRVATTLVARVAGEVVKVSPSFVVGGFFRRGEVLVKLDGRDYELAIDDAQARVAQARLALVREQAEAEVAREEWRELGEGEGDPLVLREPQVAEARAALAASEARLERSRLDLERTEIRAPFDGRVSAKRVELGQYVTPGQVLAEAGAIDYAEVRLPVPDDQLAFLDVPFASFDDSDEGPRARLTMSFAGRREVWVGRVVRTEAELDRRTRMINLVARVEDPYGLGSPSGGPPLAVGAFVAAEIEGIVAEGAVVLPRTALRSGEGDRVLVVDAEDRLRFRQVEVLRRTGDEVVIGGGLEEGEQVCVSQLDAVVDGMKVRTVVDDPSAVPVDVEEGGL